MKLILNFEFLWWVVLCLSSAEECTEFWTRWNSEYCKKPPSFIQERVTCFRAGNQTATITASVVNNFAILCNNTSPDMQLVKCLNLTDVYTLLMIDCQFRDFNVSKFLGGIYISEIKIFFEDNGFIDSMTIENIPSLRNITIYGFRTSELFTVHFGTLPNLYVMDIIDYNFIRFIYEPFRYLKNLPALRIRFGIIEVLTDDLFNRLENLQFLDLSYNHISVIEPMTFKNLTYLLDLDLSGNLISQLSSDIFTDFYSLQTLHLKENRLSKLPNDIIDAIPNLKIFDISHNHGITQLPVGLLKNAKNLYNFIAMNCSLTHLDENLFSGTMNLQKVFFVLNRIQSLPDGLFKDTKNLLFIFLGANQISFIHPRAFQNLFKLKYLQLADNKIQELPADVFLHTISLSDLDLAYNQLKDINSSLLHPLVNLKMINISYNAISSLPSTFPFGPSRYLTTVIMQHTLLEEFPSINWNHHNLTFLDLSSNVISTVTLPVRTKNKTKIVLINNKIKTISLDIQNTSGNSPIYDIRNNPIKCNCDLQNFLHFLNSDSKRHHRVFQYANTLSCYENSSIKLTDIWPVYTICPVEENCPSRCQCFLNSEYNAIVNCSGKDLSDLPVILPLHTTIIDFSNNIITDISTINLTYWYNITQLFLSHNFIESLDDFIFPPNLQVLTLNGNMLTSLPQSLMDHVTKTADFEIYLSDNKWLCSCDSIAFKKWFTRNLKKIKDSDTALCSRNIKENGTTLHALIRDTPIDIFCIDEPIISKWEIITVIAVIVFICILLIVTTVVYYRYSNTILAFLYSRDLCHHCWYNELIEEDKTYDAFICYNSEDREVIMTLIEELEPSYKLCVHERDWLPGIPISHHIVSSVQNSRKTLLLLSKNFLKSVWFQVEFKTAYDQMIKQKTHYLILVTVGELGDINQLDMELRHLLSTKTYLEWGEKWFWEKLRYALRHRRKSKNESV